MKWKIVFTHTLLKGICIYANKQMKNTENLQCLMLANLLNNIYHDRERAEALKMAVILQQTSMLDTLNTKIIMEAIGGMRYDGFECTR